MNKIPASYYIVRFSDCDPFGHLNNARYLDYFNNAREDHLKDEYQMDLSELYKKGIGWLAISHNITYLKPAAFNEKVYIQSSLIQAENASLTVEFQMMNEAKSHLKAFMWTRYVPVSLSTGKKDVHNPEFMDFLNSLLVDHPEQEYNGRLAAVLAGLKK